ncbi:unnamed protein product [Heligmosomoides polygyrus]|uniref:GNAT family N-acetyltransferase n=1 Tax=Heligmosomoides polygyrus TaxID=6339 RepID=A0A183GAZ7_HELPZ|nr:unnamed protein product [Heligmosomoides polygyrus]
MHFIRLAYQDTADVMKFLAADKEALDPLCKSLTLDKDVALIYFESLLQEAVDSGVSYVVKSASDEIIAVRLSTFRTREEAMEDAQTLHKLGYRVIAEVDQGTFSDSKKGLHKAQLVFKEMWREESYGAHVVL